MPMTSIEHVVDQGGFDASSAQGPIPAAAESPVPAALRTVTVQRHDTYWALAERELGDGLRWREIRDLNVGRSMPGGHTIVSGDDTLRAGWTLQLPAESPGTHSRSEEHTSELQSLMRNSYAVLCLKQKQIKQT